MSDRGLRGTLALALGLLLSTIPCMGARTKSANPPSHAARAATHAASLSSASPLRSGALASGELHLVGLRLVAPSSRIDVPQDAPFTVPVALFLGSRAATAAEINQLVPSTAQLVGTLSGPSISTQTLTGTPSMGLNVPGLPAAGDYTLSDIRLVNGGATLMQAEPATVAIRCLGEVLLSSVSSSPMTLAEMRDAGIQLGQGNYEARRFTMALSIGSRRVDLSVPVAIPVYNGLESLAGDATTGRLEIMSDSGVDDPMPDLHVALADIRMEPTFALSRPEVAHLVNHGFKALVVIPGSIGYLHQFYKVNLLVLNILPDGSPYVVRNVKATAMLPPGADGGVGTADDPLRLASRETETADPTKTLLGPGSNGQPGTGSPTLAPGESGAATWFIEALKEGAHLFSFRISGEFSGGTLTGPIPIQGEARAGLLVKNPTFDLALVHPDVVRRGETYTLEARLTNTSGTLANGVSLTLDQTRLANVKLLSAPSQTVDTLAPGASTTFQFQLKALKTGQVMGSYLYMEAGTIGFQLTTGIGERNIQLDPDTLVLPQTLDKLPENVREGMLRVLGQAHSIITSKGALPPGVLPIRGSTLSEVLKPALNEAGLFLGMGVDKGRIWGDLWRVFTRSGDPGFDQLLRQTTAGQDFRGAMMDALSSWAGVASPLNIVEPLASWSAGTPQPVFAAAEGTSGSISLGIVGADGSVADPTVPMPTLSGAWAATASKGNAAVTQMAMPLSGAQLRVLNTSSVDQDVNLRVSSPLLNPALPATLNHYTLRIPAGGVASVELGTVRGPSATVTSPSGSSSQALPNRTQDVSPEAFKLLAVHRYDLEMDPNATPFGTQVMILFNRPNTPVVLPAGPDGFAAGSAMVDIEANRLWQKVMAPNGKGEIPPSPAAIIQQSPRIVSLFLEKPVGPNIPRSLTLKSGWTERDGGGGAQGTYPIQCGWIPGGAVVKGKVRKTSGEGLPGFLTYWYWVSYREGGLDLVTGEDFGVDEVDYYALISNNIALEADGSFQLDYVPEPAKTALGPFTLQGKTAVGSASGTASVLGNGQVIEMDLVLEGKGDIIGTVRDGSGAPMDKVQLEAYQEQPSYGLAWSSGATRISATSDAQGAFAFRGLKTGVFSIRAKKDLLGAAVSGEIGRDGQVVTQDIVLKGQTGSLEVQVLNVDGTPRANQTVLLGIAAGLLRSGENITYVFPMEMETDSQGKARFTDVPTGDVAAVLPRMRTTVSPAWYGFLKEGETLKATLQVPDVTKLGQVEVTVSDSKGNPVQDAAIYWEQNPNWNVPAAHSDAEGKALMPAPAGAIFSVVVRHPDWPPSGGRSAGVTPLAGQTVQLPVSMPPRAWLKGQVTRPSGAPVVGAYVAIPPVDTLPSLNRLTQTDTHGNYRLPGISTVSGERVACIGPELLTFGNQTAQGLPEQDLALNFVLPEVGQNKLKGHVYQPKESGQNIGTIASLEVYGDLPNLNGDFGLPQRKLIATVRSGVDGSYAMAGLPVGAFELTGWNDFFPTKVSATGLFEGSTLEKVQDLTLFSTFTGALEGQVTRPDGQTKAGAGVRVRLLGGGVGEVTVETDANGYYAFPKVIPSGSYTLRTEDPQTGAIASGGVHLEQEVNRIRNIRLLGKGNLTLHLQDANGQPLSEGDVALAHELLSSNTLDATDFPPMADKLLSSMGGEMVFQDLWEGLVQVHLRAPNGILNGRASVRMPQGGGDAELTLRLQPSGGISGLLRRADGTLVTAGRVDAYTYVDPSFQSHYQWVGVSTTRQNAEDGRFLFEGLPVGTVWLEAWDPDSRQVGKATVTVQENQVTTLEITCQDKGPINVSVTQEGTPVQRATVNLQYRGGPALGFSAEATTDVQGKTSFQVPPGNYDVEATDPVSHAVGRQSFTRAGNQGPVQVDVSISPVRDLALNVLPPAGWTGVLDSWKARTDTGRTVNLDASGHALLQEMAVGAHSVDLSDASGRYRGSRVYQIKSDGGATQSAELQALARGGAEITVLDAHEQPMPRIYVGLQSLTGDVGSAPVPTDINGKAGFQGFLEGDHGVDARSENYNQRANGSLHISQEGEVVPVTLHLGPTASFQGTLTNGAGQAVPFTRVDYWKLSNEYSTPGSLATDAAGHFASGALPLGTYSLRASLDGLNRSGGREILLDQLDATVNADFSLNAAGRFTGRVVDPLRPAVPVVDVRVLTANSALIAHRTVDADGRFSFPDIPAQQELKVQVFMDDGATLAYSGTVNIPSEGATVDQTITLQSLPDLRGHTLTADGTAHRSMTVQLYTTGASIRLLRQGATSGDHPTFQFNYLTPGVDYELRGYEDTHLVARATVRLVDFPEIQETNLVAMALRDVGISLKYPDGAALAASGHAVLVSDLNAPDRFEADLAADGTVHFTGIAAGPYHVSISGVPNQPVLTQAIVVVEGSGEQTFDVQAQGIGTLVVAVKTASGRVLTGGSITASANGSPTWTANYRAADQSWVLDGVWTGVNLSLQASGFGTLGAAPAVQVSAHGATATIIWPAPDQGRIHGIIRDHKGQPLAGALVKVDGIQGSADSSGAYLLEGVPVGPRTLTAWTGSDPRWASTTVNLGQDNGEFVQDLALPGLGTVNVRTLDRDGNPLGNQAITLNTLGRGDATRNATTDASGNASFAGVMAGAVSASAMLEGRIVNVSGTLAADASLNLDLKARDATVVQGRIQRADTTKTWPTGTKAIVKAVEVPLAADGTLQPVGGVLDFEYSDQPIPVDLQVPGAPKLHLADLPMVKDGITQVDLTAPALGTFNVTVTKKDGSPAAGARLTSAGLPAATADAGGKASLLAFAGSYTVYAALENTAGHANGTVAQDDESIPLAIALGDVLDVSGLYNTPRGVDMLLYQDGADLSGEWYTESTGWGKRFLLKGTLDGTHVKLTFYTLDNLDGAGWMDITFAPDGLSYTGTHSYYGANWNGTRKPGVFLKVSPERATLAVNGTLPLKVLVAGSPDKRVTWTASAGSMAADGTYTAPAAPAFVEVTATSVADQTQKAIATISVTADGKLDVSGFFNNSLLLFQQGDVIAGKWSDRAFDGTLTGQTLSGTWQSTTSSGHFQFQFTGDGSQFSGTWGIGESSTGYAMSGNRRIGTVGIFVRPEQGRVRPSGTLLLKAYVVGTSDRAVTWSATGYGPVTVDASGLFTASTLTGWANVKAISTADASKTATASLQVVLPVVITPSSAVLPVGGTSTFMATMTGFTNNEVIWTTSGGTITPGGLYTAPETPGIYNVTATSVEDSSLKASVDVVVRPFITIDPAHATIYLGEQQRFYATLTGLAGGVAWSASAGAITAYGDYTAPATTGTYTITATSSVDPTKSATATVEVKDRSISVTPSPATVYVTENQRFTASVRGLANTAVTWSASGGSIDTNGLFTAPAGDSNLTVTATSVADPALAATVEVKVLHRGSLAVTLATADGRPVANRDLWVTVGSYPNFEYQREAITDTEGKASFPGAPIGSSLTLTDDGPNLPWQQRQSPWYATMPARTYTLTQSGEAQTVNPVLPVGKLHLQYRRGSEGIPSVQSSLDIAGSICPWQWPNNADASGDWTLLDVPLNQNLALNSQRAYITVNKVLVLDQPETTVTVEWPPLAGKQTVKVLRANGAPVANPETLGFQAYPGNEDGSSTPDEGTGAERSWNRMVPGFEQTTMVQLDIPTPFLKVGSECGGLFFAHLQTEGRFTPSLSPETHELRLPVLVSLRLRFQDKDGMPLPSSLPGDQIVLSFQGNCGNAAYALPSLDNCLLPEMFKEGQQVLYLRSERWGDLPDIIFTVAPSDDGKTLEQIVKLPWVKTDFDVKVLAGDHETPVPGAALNLTTGGTTIELTRVAEGMKDTDSTKVSFFGPSASDLKLEASFTPRRLAVAVTDHLDNQTSGRTIQTTLTLPLTVVRTHLMETDGTTELEGQGLDAKAPSDLGDLDPEPTASISGKIFGLALGEAAGSTMDLRMYDPDSGLGILQSATVPALGTHLDVTANLAPHAWLTSATLTSASSAPYLLIALGRDASELVKPEAASWLQGPDGIGSLKVPVFIYTNSLSTELFWDRPASEVPDPTNPPEPALFWKPQVRIPLSGSIWAAAWTLAAEDQGDGTFKVRPTLDPFGKGSLAATADQQVATSADPLTWVWNGFSLQVVDAASQPLSGATFQAWPLSAPGSWRVDTNWNYSDAQGLWTLSLPTDGPIHAQTMAPNCGTGTWLFGSLDFTPTDPPPATPPVLHATETRDLPPCPPHPPVAKAVKTKKAGARKPNPPRMKKAGR